MEILDEINDIPRGLAISDKLNLKKINIAEANIDNDLNFIYLDDNDSKSVKLLDDCKFKPIIPYLNIQRFIIYITGKSGCGKSLIAYTLVLQYHTIFPNNKIYYICATDIKDDENFGNLEYIKQIDPEKFYGNDMSIEDERELMKTISNSIFIFDDIDMVPKDKKKLYTRLQSKLVECGRKYNISIIIISHITLGGQNTKMILNEIDMYFCFKNNLKNNGYLINYLKYEKEDLYKLDTSSWICFNNKYDCIITPKTIKLL